MRHVGVVLALVAAVVSAPAGAQETTGAIIGVVSSVDGLPLPGVQLTVENPEVGFSQIGLSRGNGSYRFPALAPALYQITAMSDGFKTAVRQVTVSHGHTVTADFTMEVGSFSETIEVTGEAPQIDVTSTVSGLAVNSDALFDTIPVQREVTNVALLAPGTVETARYYQQAGSTGLLTPEQGFASFSGASMGNSIRLT